MRDPDLIEGSTPHLTVMDGPEPNKLRRIIRLTPVIGKRITNHRAACRACSWTTEVNQSSIADAQRLALDHINLACQFEKIFSKPFERDDQTKIAKAVGKAP